MFHIFFFNGSLENKADDNTGYKMCKEIFIYICSVKVGYARWYGFFVQLWTSDAQGDDGDAAEVEVEDANN